jgi:hypothetical protein
VGKFEEIKALAVEGERRHRVILEAFHYWYGRATGRDEETASLIKGQAAIISIRRNFVSDAGFIILGNVNATLSDFPATEPESAIASAVARDMVETERAFDSAMQNRALVDRIRRSPKSSAEIVGEVAKDFGRGVSDLMSGAGDAAKATGEGVKEALKYAAIAVAAFAVLFIISR